jgi:hypothetical protein
MYFVELLLLLYSFSSFIFNHHIRILYLWNREQRNNNTAEFFFAPAAVVVVDDEKKIGSEQKREEKFLSPSRFFRFFSKT